jgi:hemolysin activation/secretion protein
VTAQLGWAGEDFGSDRDALLYSASASRGLGAIDRQALLLSARASGRIESGDTRNAVVALNARYFRQQSDKRVFFATLDAARGHALDPENTLELGGDTGLRGYPLRYQAGDARLLLTAEQRYYWDWYPWRLFRVGGAIFADIGRTWGPNPVGAPNLGWLRDAGVGLRFASTRSGGDKVIHLDVAFPFDGDASIDDVQIQIESKRGF